MNRSFAAVLGPAVLVVSSLVACSKPSADNAQPTPSPAATAAQPATPAAAAAGGDNGGSATPAELEAVSIFKARCSTCHGMDGKGNGPASITLNPKPRNYTDAAWQKSVTDDHIREIIVKGGAAMGKSPNMLANPDLADKPDVVTALMHKVRSFGPKVTGDAG